MNDTIQICLLTLGLVLVIYFAFFYKKENFITKLMSKSKSKSKIKSKGKVKNILIEDFEGKNDPVNQKMIIDTENYSITEKYDSPKKPQQREKRIEREKENEKEQIESESEIITENKDEESINLNIFENNNDNIKLVRNDNNKYDALNEGYMSEVQMAPFSEVERMVESEAQEDFNVDLANDDFIKANYFKGKKEGYVFKKGKKGLGYYLDNYNGDLKNSP